jgi:hypothetical protein
VAVLDAVESAGRYIAAIHSFPSPANLTISFTRIPKFSSVPHRVPDLPAESVPFDPGYLPGSPTRARSRLARSNLNCKLRRLRCSCSLLLHRVHCPYDYAC